MNRQSSESGPSSIRIPAEWEARHGTLLAWPMESQAWRGQYASVVSFFQELVSLLREQEPVVILVPPEERDHVAKLLGGESGELSLMPYRSNDIWMRDAGPIGAWASTDGGEAQSVLLDGNFNGWGGKYPHEMDRLIPTVLARRWRQNRQRLSLTLEGGAIEGNGQGDLLTTEAVLLNTNRGNADRSTVEQQLKQEMGVSRVHWLGEGLAGDDTDGHIDNLARFVSHSCLVCPQVKEDTSHPNYDVLSENLRRLSAMELTTGRAEVVTLPSPVIQSSEGRLLPASYANFYLSGEQLIVPVFGQPEDDKALAILGALLPQHRVKAINARPVLAHGGGVHCLTQPVLSNWE